MDADTDIPAKPDIGEVASARDSDENIGLWANGIREARDPVLGGRGGDLKFYDQVRIDGQVWSTLQQRRDALVARPWEVRPGAEDPASEEAAERLQDELTALDWDAVTRQMHWGVFYGYSVGECMWGSEGGRWTFADIRVRRARRFGFDVDGNLMLRPVLGRTGEVRMPDAKFWVMSTFADSGDEPYGLGLAHLLYWPVYFKRAGLRSWMLALDKHASPTAYGSFPPGTTPEDQDKLLAMLQAIRQDSAIIYPEGMDVGYLSSAKSASMDHSVFDARMDAWITKVVLSQTMTTEDGSSRSQSETHMDVRDEITASDADLMSGSFNSGPVEWWTWWNYGDRATPPQVVRVMDDEEDQNQAAERDVKLAQIGWKPDEARVLRVYGEGYKRSAPVAPAVPGAPVPPPDGAPPEFADEEPDAVGAFVDELIASGAAPEAAADILAPVVDAVESAGSLAELGEALDALELGDDLVGPLHELLSQAAFAARIGGEVGASLRDDVEVETP